MASTYSPNLRLELIGTGEQQGTWGVTTNTNLGTLLEEAIGGYTTVTVADAGDTTLTTANGAADQSRNMTINLTGTLTASRNVIVPAIEKVYLVKNATSGGFAVTVKVSGQTGVSIANGTTMLVFVDGTDVRQAGAQVGASNSLVLAAGSASAPSLTTTGDTNTGLCFPAADTISASTGGTERMRIDTSGNVGIGTTSPGGDANTRAVTATGSTGAQFTAISGTVNSIYAAYSAYGALAGPTSNHILGFQTNNTERMRIDTSGNVGIGTSSAGNKLTVYGASGVGIAATNSTTGTGASNGVQLAVDSTTGGYLWNYSVGFLSLGTGASERMRIDSSGNVGIGTASPSNFGGANLQVQNSNIGSILWSDGTITGQLLASASAEVTVGSRSNHPLRLGTNDTERMRITAGGEVYIAGTTDQGAYNLQCNGTGVWGAGAYVNGSDARIKDDIAPIGSCLDIVASLNPVTFKYKEDWSKDQSVQPGFIAQELQASLGNTNYVDGVVVQGPEYMSVAYQSLIPVLTKALQEALTKINALEARIATLKAA